MTKIQGFDELSDRLKLLRAEIEGLYTELWAAGLHGAKQALDRAVPPLSQAIQSVECAAAMERDQIREQESLVPLCDFSATTR